MMREQEILRETDVDAERCSALMDAELAADEFRAALAVLRADPREARRWAIYHAVGDALRSSEVAACHNSRFAQALHERLAVEPTVIARKRRARVWLPALGVAASLAALAWAVLPMMALPSGAERVALATAPQTAGAMVVTGGSEAALRGYLNAHLELSGGTAFAAPLSTATGGIDLLGDL